jgi:hypothetical protein
MADDRPGGGNDGTRSAPAFVQSARDLIARLEHDDTAEGAGLLSEARELEQVFLSWTTRRPMLDVRVATLQKMVDLNRRVLEHVASRTEPHASRLASAARAR